MNDDQSQHDTGLESEQASSERRWQPLNARQRRVLGVLVEKAKTTVDAYPLTLNALTNGCNQKSNRSPQMNLSGDEIEAILEELRGMGAVAEVQGGGRVSKYRHLVYDWLGVDKVEAAVMAELLLRGEQTLGELRGRAARMEPIADIQALRPVVDSLVAKGLVVELSPAGRGQVVTHALYRPKELEALREWHHNQPAASSSAAASASSAAPSRSATSSASRGDDGQFEALQQEVAELRSQLDELREQVRRLEAQLA